MPGNSGIDFAWTPTSIAKKGRKVNVVKFGDITRAHTSLGSNINMAKASLAAEITLGMMGSGWRTGAGAWG